MLHASTSRVNDETLKTNWFAFIVWPTLTITTPRSISIGMILVCEIWEEVSLVTEWHWISFHFNWHTLYAIRACIQSRLHNFKKIAKNSTQNMCSIQQENRWWSKSIQKYQFICGANLNNPTWSIEHRSYRSKIVFEAFAEQSMFSVLSEFESMQCNNSPIRYTTGIRPTQHRDRAARRRYNIEGQQNRAESTEQCVLTGAVHFAFVCPSYTKLFAE